MALEPITADALALIAMRDKGFASTDTGMKLDFTQRFVWTLNRMLAHGKVRKIGRGPEARWALPD